MDPERRGYVGRRIQHPGKSERRGTAQEGTRAVPNRHRGKFHSQLPKLVKVCGPKRMDDSEGRSGKRQINLRLPPVSSFLVGTESPILMRVALIRISL